LTITDVKPIIVIVFRYLVASKMIAQTRCPVPWQEQAYGMSVGVDEYPIMAKPPLGEAEACIVPPCATTVKERTIP
jgi:hypothetical protein